MKYLFLYLFFISSLLSSSQINCVDVKKLPSVSSLNDTTIFPIDTVFHMVGDIKLFQARPLNWFSNSTQYLSFDTLTGEMFYVGSIGIDVSSSTYSCKKLTFNFVQDRVVIDGDTLVPSGDTTIVHPNWKYKSVDVLGLSQVTITGSFNKVVLGQSTNILSNICLDSCQPTAGISTCINVKKLPSVSSLNDTTIFPIGSVFHTEGDIKLFQARPLNWISNTTQYISVDTLTGELFFVGSIGIDVSASAYSCKKLTFIFGQALVVIDSDTLHLNYTGDTTIVMPNWTYKSDSGQISITGSFNKVIVGRSTNIISNICLDSCDKNLTTIDETVSTQKLESLSVYPNPTNGLVHIQYRNKGNYSIYSLDGKMVVENRRLDSNITILNISGLNPGMYLLKLVTEEGNVITKRIVKQ